MKTNVGKTDKIVRLILSAVIAILGLYYQSWWGLVALIPLVTGLVGTCPLYLPFGLSTRSVASEKS